MSGAAPSVVFVDTELTRVFGGAQVFLGHLLPGLVDAGWQVTLVTEGRALPPLADQLRAAGAEVTAGVWPQPSTVASGGRRLAGWVNARTPVIYVISASGGVGWAAVPRLAPNIATLAVAHSDSDTFYRPFTHYRQFLSTSVAVSIPIELELRARLPDTQVAFVPYGVPIADQIPLKPNRGRQQVEVAYVGRFSQANKRFRDVVEIAARLSGPGTHFTILGDGEERNFAERRLQRQLSEGHVVLPGWQDQKELRRNLAAADIILFTSPPHSEGLPLALLEAMGLGIIPVTTDIPAFRQAVPGHDVGPYCPVGDIEAFVATIEQLRDAPAERSRRQIEVWQQSRHFSVGAMVTAYDRLLTEAAEWSVAHPRRNIRNHPLMESCRSRYPPPLPQLKAVALRMFYSAGSLLPDGVEPAGERGGVGDAQHKPDAGKAQGVERP